MVTKEQVRDVLMEARNDEHNAKRGVPDFSGQRRIRLVVVALAAERDRLAEELATERRRKDRALALVADTEKALAAQVAECVALFESFKRMATHPMKSMDAGRVIDAQRVEDECEDLLAKLKAGSR